MDYDLEIIDEEGDDSHDPLFDSIMNAMNSMKEATADKIYQKIQKEGEMNYSKPQVDRALANALRYGIFEVRNNRYKLRDDILDDEDTVYWKFPRNRQQTPFRIQEDMNDRQSGLRLDPEKDNQRFRRVFKKKSDECPHCGKMKKPEFITGKLKRDKRGASFKKNRKNKKKMAQKNQSTTKRTTEIKRKRKLDSTGGCSRVAKRRKNPTNEPDFNEPEELCDKEFISEEKLPNDLMNERNTILKNTVQNEINFSPSSNISFEHLAEEISKYNKRQKNLQSQHMPECKETNLKTVTSKGSSISVKSESESEKTDLSYDSDGHSPDKSICNIFDDLPSTSKNINTNNKMRNLSSGDTYESSLTDHRKEKSDWLGCSEEPQGAIIQSNNVLTIEPMDSLAFNSPEQASYIS